MALTIDLLRRYCSPSLADAAIRYHADVDLVRTERGDDQNIDALRARVVELDAVLAARSAEVARVETELTAFKIRYRHEVGLLHEELDDLELKISEFELGEIARRLENDGLDSEVGSGAPKADTGSRYTSDAVRKLFRDVAKVIHPDLASDDHGRDRRHSLMIEANRAYALGDEERLRSILHAWERSPEAVQGSGDEATRLRLERRIAQINEQLEGFDGDLAELKESPLWKLKVMVDDASSRGKDLVGDMVRRLKRDIMAARNRFDAMR
jgi:hypothetical protein